MQTIGIGELQKNMGILTHLTEPITIVDKRKGRDVAVVYPVSESRESIVDKLAGSLRDKAKKRGIVIEDLDKAREEAMMEAMKEKYGFSD